MTEPERDDREQPEQGADRPTAQPPGQDPLIALAYLPLIGWTLQHFLEREGELWKFHSRQSLRLNLALLVIFFSVWFLENFPFFAWLFGPGEIFHPLSRAVWLLSALAFTALSVYCAYQGYSGEKWEIPWLENKWNGVREFIKRSLD